MQASFWWPDYNIRFFRRGSVTWKDEIHSRPEVEGQGITLPTEERWAITHYNYTSVSEFILRMDRYTTIQAKELLDKDTSFTWKDLLQKPLSEFLSRFFSNKGYQDGLHGLALSLLQAFSFLTVYIKLWEYQGFKSRELDGNELSQYKTQAGTEINYWLKTIMLSSNPVKRTLQKVRNKIIG